MKRALLETAIITLKKLIDRGERSESKYQKYFEDNLVVFEVLGYTSAYPKPRLEKRDGDRLEPDFLVRRPDGLFEIFELKTPHEKLIREKKSRDKFDAKVNEYISQVETYSEYFDDDQNRDLVMTRYAMDVQKKPTMILVVGRDSGVDKKLLHLLTKRRTNALQIFTYDDVLSILQFRHAALFGHSENLTGASWHAIITLHAVLVPRRQYIFDAGDALSRNRWSVYLNENRGLCFEILDKDGTSYLLTARPEQHGLEFGAQSYICCEFGSSDKFSVMQILIDNRIVARQEIMSSLSVSSALDFSKKTIAADIEGKRHGTFTLAGLAIYGNTLTFQQRHALTVAVFDEFFAMPSPEDLLTSRARSKFVLPNSSAYLVIGDGSKPKET